MHFLSIERVKSFFLSALMDMLKAEHSIVGLFGDFSCFDMKVTLAPRSEAYMQRYSFSRLMADTLSVNSIRTSIKIYDVTKIVALFSSRKESMLISGDDDEPANSHHHNPDESGDDRYSRT